MTNYNEISEPPNSERNISVGDRVWHVKNPGVTGVVKAVIKTNISQRPLVKVFWVAGESPNGKKTSVHPLMWLLNLGRGK